LEGSVCAGHESAGRTAGLRPLRAKPWGDDAGSGLKIQFPGLGQVFRDHR